MTLLDFNATETRQDAVRFWRPSGSSCARRGPMTRRQSPRSSTIGGSRRTRCAFRILGLADAESFIATANADDGERAFLITRGAACSAPAGSSGRTAKAEIGYWLGVAFWGQGYATEAARALIDHAFGDLGYDRLAGGARVSNPASRRVLEKCGFQWTGSALPHPGAGLVRTGRSLPARPPPGRRSRAGAE